MLRSPSSPPRPPAGQSRRHPSEWLECFYYFQKACCWRRLHFPQVVESGGKNIEIAVMTHKDTDSKRLRSTSMLQRLKQRRPLPRLQRRTRSGSLKMIKRICLCSMNCRGRRRLPCSAYLETGLFGLFFQPEQCFSLTTIQPEQCLSASFSQVSASRTGWLMVVELL
ncbi:uncharacterized protein [Miscanthus floridulus]|uniref:uncharacterized protein isoform X2 n=1 Tax=Miscanthus floridulus TaxID=154761 RepID=UPI0034599FCD